MGQAKRHRETVYRASNNMCIYCGGGTQAETIDHMPPRSMFDRRDRPAGLEFGACKPCNEGARLVDLAAALIGRIYPDTDDPTPLDEFQHYLGAVANNLRGLLEEMAVPAAQEKHGLQRLGLTREQGPLLRIDGPIALKCLEIFGARLGMALHFEQTRQIIPPEGGVMVRVYSNIDMREDKIPRDVFGILPPPLTLSQGKKRVDEQFRYGARSIENKTVTMGFALFRLSFSLLTFASVDRKFFSIDHLVDKATLYQPGALQLDLPLTFRG